MEIIIGAIGYIGFMWLMIWMFNNNIFRKITKRIRLLFKGIETVSYDEIIASVSDHSLYFKKKNVEVSAKVEKRNFEDSLMLGRGKDKVWWYLRTNEKSGHDVKDGFYREGDTYTFRIYIRDIEFRYYDNNGDGRYYIWSEIID